MSRLITQSSTHTRPNSLLRAFSSTAAIVRYRNEYSPVKSFLINGFQTPSALFSKIRAQFPAQMKMSFLQPEEYIANGCYGAVWAARYSGPDTDAIEEGTSPDLAVKVLYNYYAASPDATGSSGVEDIVQDIHDAQYLSKQVDRECDLRPPTGHANIVPVLGKFFDKAPPPPSSADSLDTSAAQGRWTKVEEFPEGFGGRPTTCYLLMPKFDGTLDDLINEKWQPTAKLLPSVDSASGICATIPSMSPLNMPAITKTFRLEVGEAVAIVAQIFEAVAELERCQIAHRDLKANNILVQSRPPPDEIAVQTLNVSEMEAANSRLLVALTDFGCAVRTGSSSFPHYTEPSGNPALRAPEVATYFKIPEDQRGTEGIDYSRADIWAAATIVYTIFGLENPFLSGQLSSLDYDETELPELPNWAPGIICWLVKACLRRDPSTRPPAALVADLLHVWCLLRQLNFQNPQSTTSSARTAEKQSNVYRDILEQCKFSTEDFKCGGAEQAAHRFARRLRPLYYRINSLLQTFWTYDSLMGAASPTRQGLRVEFHRRITPQRFAFCVNIIRFAGLDRVL